MDEGNWTYEFFYFGNGGWPSDATWRHDGDRYQYMVELDRPNSFEDAVVLWTYYSTDERLLEPTFHSDRSSGSIVGLHVWVDANKADYLEDRRAAWPLPDGSYADPRETWEWLPLEKGPTLF